jgi:hypothetical protein
MSWVAKHLQQMSLPGEKVRPERRSLPVALISIVAFLGVSTIGAKEPRGPAWPSNVRVIEALRAPEFVRPKTVFGVPQLRVYDARGHLLLNERGHRPEINLALREIFAGKRTPDESHTLSQDLILLIKPDGEPVATNSEASFTLVKFWAVWCRPCHRQSRDLAEIFADFKEIKFVLVHVDADRKR